MGLFGRRDQADPRAAEPAPPPAPVHPALASADAMVAASPADLAAALLVLGFGDQEAGASRYGGDVNRLVHEAIGAAEGRDGFAVFQERGLGALLEEGFGVLERSLLVTRTWTGNTEPYVAATRRGRRALDSGDPAAWMDVPADPS